MNSCMYIISNRKTSKVKKPDLHYTLERAYLLSFGQKLTSKMIEHANIDTFWNRGYEANLVKFWPPHQMFNDERVVFTLLHNRSSHKNNKIK